MRVHFQAALAVLCVSVHAQSPANWSLARSPHFEAYTQASPEQARAAVLRLEQLRAFFAQQTGLKPDGPGPVRVIAFRSVREYEPYRLRVPADAYYVGTEGRDYLVLSSLNLADFGTAAHEYAHALQRAAGFHLPPWLGEGLAEFLSTARVGERGSSIGGELPARAQMLRRPEWIPLPQLLAIAAEPSSAGNRDRASLFYAESWALTDMLLLSPEYEPRFSRLASALHTGARSAQALPAVYGKSLAEIERDLRVWVDRRRIAAVPLPGVAAGAFTIDVTPVSAQDSRLLLADLLAASGELVRAEAAYTALAREVASSAEVPAALGAIALRKGDTAGAQREWQRAISLGIADAALCYRYGQLASTAGVSPAEVRAAYQRALALRPDFDDARYALALLEKNLGENEAALADLRAMHNVAPVRAYHYWAATADALTQLGRREEAQAAAQKAAENAGTSAERAGALQLAWIARTELAAQFVRDGSGANQLVMTRVPRDTSDWNPFVEPGDSIRRVRGTLREIECGESLTRFQLDTDTGVVTLTIPDLAHLQARNAPAELICGPQEANAVTVVYATAAPGGKTDGVLRGIEFH